MLTYQEALALVLAQKRNFGEEQVALSQSLGRVLSEKITADRDYPPFNRSAMDGIAIRHIDYIEGIRYFTLKESVFAGEKAIHEIKKGECYKIMTGAAVPAFADTVIRLEDIVWETNTLCRINDIIIKPTQNIARKGEDLRQNQLVLNQSTLIEASHIGLLASLGKYQLNVKKTPTISIISTGNEVRAIDNEVNDFQIRDSNSHVLEAFLSKYRIMDIKRELARDEESTLKKILTKHLESDILFISGGVSAGEADFIPNALEEIGVKKIFHKIQIKPGKPLWFGTYHEKTTVFAMPGNPFSVQIGYKILVEPYLRACFGLTAVPPLNLPISESRTKKVKFDEFFPVNIQFDPILQVTPVKFNGSGDISASLSANGFGFQPALLETIEKNQNINSYLW